MVNNVIDVSTDATLDKKFEESMIVDSSESNVG
jgi:hypothetical protein